METYNEILQILTVVLLIIGIIYRKQSWGQKLLYFAIGMLAWYILTTGVRAFIDGFNAGLNNVKH